MSPEAPDNPGLPDLQTFRAEVFARKQLPTVPAVLGRILAVTAGERSSTRELVEVIERDQALTGRVLKLANSALFGLNRGVATIPRALVLIGFTTVRNLALGVKVWDALAVGGRRRQIEELWSHSAIVAAAAKLIAARVQGVDPDESFTAGLLHDVGKLVFSLKLGVRYWTLIEAADEEHPAAEIERTQLGVDHAEAGGWLAESWQLPPTIVAAIRDHHSVETNGNPWSASRIVYTADCLVHATDFGTCQLRPVADDVLAQAAERGLTAEMWVGLIGPLKAEADTVSGLFRGP